MNTNELAKSLRELAEQTSGDPWPSANARLLIESAEALEHFGGHLPCPHCEQSGIIGTDYFGEGIDCPYCDDGRIKAADVKDLRDRFDAAAGDYMAIDHALGLLLAAEGESSEVRSAVLETARSIYGDRELPNLSDPAAT